MIDQPATTYVVSVVEKPHWRRRDQYSRCLAMHNRSPLRYPLCSIAPSMDSASRFRKGRRA